MSLWGFPEAEHETRAPVQSPRGDSDYTERGWGSEPETRGRTIKGAPRRTHLGTCRYRWDHLQDQGRFYWGQNWPWRPGAPDTPSLGAGGSPGCQRLAHLDRLCTQREILQGVGPSCLGSCALHLCCPGWQPLAHVATWHLKCGWCHCRTKLLILFNCNKLRFK